MFGLVLKDFLVAKKYLKSLLFIAFFYIFVGFFMDDVTFICGAIIISFSIMSVTSFTYDDLAKWDRYALSMPISRSDVVFSKYTVGIFCAVIGFITALIVSLISEFANKKSIDSELLITNLALLSVAIIFVSIIIPLTIKFGTERGRLMIIMVFALPSVLVMALNRLDVPMPSQETIKDFIFLLPFIMVILIVISYFISVKIYKAKEF